MKIAISAEQSRSDGPIDSRFGRAKIFMIYDDEKTTWEPIDNKQNQNCTQGAGIQSAANIVNTGCKVLISGHCGPKAFAALSRARVNVYIVTGGTVQEALAAYQSGNLLKIDSADVDGHW